MHTRRFVLPALLGCIVTGCETPQRPDRADLDHVQLRPSCQLGCQDQDPSPSSPGVFLGDGATPEDCFDEVQNDVDVDGVGDYCELRVALAFAPQLVVGRTDFVGREPRWAVKEAYNEGEMHALTILYALSYYVDLGTVDPLCGNFFAASLCAGHAGDSEDLMFRVDFDEESQHRVLTEAALSQHGNHQVLEAGANPYVHGLAYPDHPGAAPRVWVAWGKHANYPSVTACDNGAFLHLDACQAPFDYVPIGADGDGNLGSSSYPLIDCVSSTNPLYSGNGEECYWTEFRFSGWQFVNPDCTGYRSILLGQGF